MDNGLVEARPSASRLIDNVSRNAIANRVVGPAFRPVCRSLNTRSRIARTVYDDERPGFGDHRSCELHIHAADDFLYDGLSRLWSAAIARQLRRATDVERASVTELQRLCQVSVLRWRLPRRKGGNHGPKGSARCSSPWASVPQRWPEPGVRTPAADAIPSLLALTFCAFAANQYSACIQARGRQAMAHTGE